jgi:choline monooxygenase
MLEHNPNIAQASTPDKRLYNDSDLYQKMVEKVFATSWQLVGDADNCKVPGSVWPQILLEGCLDEPIVFTRDKEDNLHCLSNVCTHRGMMVCENAGNERFLRCRYHGRRFGMDGKFLSMPEFEGVEMAKIFVCESISCANFRRRFCRSGGALWLDAD